MAYLNGAEAGTLGRHLCTIRYRSFRLCFARLPLRRDHVVHFDVRLVVGARDDSLAKRAVQAHVAPLMRAQKPLASEWLVADVAVERAVVGQMCSSNVISELIRGQEAFATSRTSGRKMRLNE